MDDAPVQRHLPAGEQPAHELDRLCECGDGRLAADAERAVVRPSGAETEHRAAAGQLVERRDRGRDQGRLAAERVRHAGSEPNRARRAGERGEHRERIVLEPVVGHPDLRVAVRLRRARRLDERRDGLPCRKRDAELGQRSHASAILRLRSPSTRQPLPRMDEHGGVLRLEHRRAGELVARAEPLGVVNRHRVDAVADEVDGPLALQRMRRVRALGVEQLRRRHRQPRGRNGLNRSIRLVSITSGIPSPSISAEGPVAGAMDAIAGHAAALQFAIWLTSARYSESCAWCHAWTR